MYFYLYKSRAPEVVLGLPFTEAIDMWAIGCTLACFYMGRHLFHLNTAYQYLAEIVELLGQPDDQLLRDGEYADRCFIEDLAADDSTWKLRTYPSSGPAESQDRLNFIKLLKGLLCVDPKSRLTPEEAVRSPFITMENLAGPFQNTTYFALSKDAMRTVSPEEVSHKSEPQKFDILPSDFWETRRNTGGSLRGWCSRRRPTGPFQWEKRTIKVRQAVSRSEKIPEEG
ncbi:homeodomain-interacting protein kinase 3-like [Brachionichthys hirsutus]|uniref:homeodomain-interacting protein kinase 3-like n=1 Tax=Brachionichthys hirsutus TaxID=412623 RepID=UPI00360456E2